MFNCVDGLNGFGPTTATSKLDNSIVSSTTTFPAELTI